MHKHIINGFQETYNLSPYPNSYSLKSQSYDQSYDHIKLNISSPI